MHTILKSILTRPVQLSKECLLRSHWFIYKHYSNSSSSNSGDVSTTHFGFKDVPKEQKAALVGQVFSNVADKYDVMNDAMSLGIHRIWKDTFVQKLNPLPGLKLLDVAGGTGDIAFRVMDQIKIVQKSGRDLPGSTFDNLTSSIVVCDINFNMLNVGKHRAEAQQRESTSELSLNWTVGDAEQLPVPSNSMDAYTIAFGIRNVTNIEKALREAHRVLVRGGRFMCLEFSQTNQLIKPAYDLFSFEVIPALGDIIAQDRDSYQYLVESIRKFPDQSTFAQMIRNAGFKCVSYENLSLGIVAIHSGFKL